MGSKVMGKMGSFPPTQWSLVALAGKDDESRLEALERLLRTYLPALKAHLVLSRKTPPDQAEDMLQGFICDKIIQERLISKAVQGRGKFRSYLRRALDNYVISLFRHDQAKKRVPEQSLVMFEEQTSKIGTNNNIADSFDLSWAKNVIQGALEAMRSECGVSNRLDIWRVFEKRILITLEGKSPLPYEIMVEQFGFRSPLHAANVLVTAKRMYKRHLRAIVAEYSKDESQVDDEIRELGQILSNARA